MEELCRLGVTHVVGVPDNGSRALFERLWAQAGIEVILVSREGEAFAVACGLHVGGKRPFVIIQNTGLLEAGDAFRGTAYNMGIPLVSLVGYRGYHSMAKADDWTDTAATFLEPTLKAWRIPYSVMKDDADIEQIAGAFEQAEQTGLPRAVLLTAETV